MIFYILFHHIIIVKLQILSLGRNLKKEPIDYKFICLREHNPFLKKYPNFISIRTGANTAFKMITRISLFKF